MLFKLCKLFVCLTAFFFLFHNFSNCFGLILLFFHLINIYITGFNFFVILFFDFYNIAIFDFGNTSKIMQNIQMKDVKKSICECFCKKSVINLFIIFKWCFIIFIKRCWKRYLKAVNNNKTLKKINDEIVSSKQCLDQQSYLKHVFLMSSRFCSERVSKVNDTTQQHLLEQ